MNAPPLAGRQIASAACALSGLLIVIGVITGQQEWLRLLPSSSPPYLNAGILLLLCARLVWDEHARPNLVTQITAWTIVVWAALVLSQSILNIDLGIDWPAVHQGEAGVAHPGRMGPNTCLAFAFNGLAVALMHGHGAGRWRRYVILGLILCGLLIALAGVAGYLLDLQSMYQVMTYNRMSVLASSTLVLVGTALWAAWIAQSPLGRFDLEENRITGTAVAVLGLVALLVGMSTFATLQSEFKSALGREVGQMASVHATSFAHSLSQEIDAARNAAGQVAMRQALARWNKGGRTPADHHVLEDTAQSLGTRGISAVTVQDATGRDVVELGLPHAPTSALRLPLPASQAELLWDEGLILLTRTPIIHEGQRQGIVTTESRLTVLTDFLDDLRQGHATWDVLLCGGTVAQLVCTPSRRMGAASPQPTPVVSPPLAKALLGGAGTEQIVMPDGRRLLSGYAQVGTFDLALSVEKDLGELYAPLKERLKAGIVLVAVFVAAGAWLMRARVHPLTEQLASDQRRMRAVLATTHEAFIATSASGRISEWNVEAQRTFGWRREEVLGKHMLELLIPPRLRVEQLRQLRLMADSAGDMGSGPGARLELIAMRRDGQEFPIEISMNRTGDDGSHYYAAFLRDISERQHAQQQLADSEQRLRDVINSVPALIGYVDTDERCHFFNDLAMKVLQLQPDQLPGISLRDAVGEADYEQHQAGIREALAGRPAVINGVPKGTRKAFYRAHLVPDRGPDGAVKGFYLMTFDVTPLKEAEYARAQGEQRLRTITDNLPVLISYIDRDNRVQFANGTFRDWMGLDPKRVIGKPVPDVIGRGLYRKVAGYLEQCLSGQRVDFEMKPDVTGTERHLQTSILPDTGPDGAVVGMYALSADVTALKTVEQRLLQLARHDPLTGLPNRLQFDERLPEAMARSDRSRRPLALMFLDVDKFKTINDTLGHAVGDEVLKEFGRRLSTCVRRTDLVARLAGDEFVIVLEGLNSLEEPQFVARKVLAAMRCPFQLERLTLEVSTSIGVALYAGAPISPAGLLARADEALYQAKTAGRNTYCMAAAQAQ